MMDLVARMKIAVPSMFGHWVRGGDAIGDDLLSRFRQHGQVVSGESEREFFGWEAEFRVTRTAVESLVYVYSGDWETEDVFSAAWSEPFEFLFEDVAHFINSHA